MVGLDSLDNLDNLVSLENQASLKYFEKARTFGQGPKGPCPKVRVCEVQRFEGKSNNSRIWPKISPITIALVSNFSTSCLVYTHVTIYYVIYQRTHREVRHSLQTWSLIDIFYQLSFIFLMLNLDHKNFTFNIQFYTQEQGHILDQFSLHIL